MKWSKAINKWTVGAMAVLFVLLINVVPAKAETYTYGVLTYTISNGEIVIKDCDTSASGELEIPREIDGYSVTSINDYAFASCKNLTSVIIPEGVTSIGYGAFMYCEGLMNIHIPNSLTRIEQYTFDKCSSLENVYITDIKSWCEIAFERENANPMSMASHLYLNEELVTDLIIPENITRIRDYVFYGCQDITSVHITNLEAWCRINFDSSYSNPLRYAKELYLNGEILTDVVIPEGITDIGAFAFCGYSGLKQVTLPDGVKSIGSSAFYRCANLLSINIPNSVTSIGSSAFFDCSSLVSMTIPEGVKSVAASTFSSCSSLVNITIPEGITSIGSRAFYGCRSLADITIPESVVNIGDEAFYGCNSLTRVIVPKGVANIGKGVFRECSRLASVTLPEGLTQIGEMAFAYCRSLTSITLPEGVASIGTYAFSNCSKLVSVTMLEGVTSISSYAFNNCSELASVTIPKGLTSIGGSAFYGCSSLENVYITDIRAWCQISFQGYYANPLGYAEKLYLNGELVTNLVIPEGTTYISNNAFYRYNMMESIVIPSTVTSIGADNFKYCSADFVVYLNSAYVKEYAQNHSLNYIIIPDSIVVKTIPSKTVYYLGEELDTTGLTLSLNYYDGTSGELSSGFIATGLDSTREGTCKITVSYLDKETSFNVTVTKNIQKLEYEINKKIYRVGDSCDLIGKTMHATYENGGVITEDVTITEAMISGFNTSTSGAKTIVINYYNATFEYDIVVMRNESDCGSAIDVVYDEIQEYTGSSITPKVEVAFCGSPLIENVDYVLAYENNTQCGNSAKIIITGSNLYDGFKVERTFVITRKDISSAVVSKISDQAYTGSAIKPSVSVTIDGQTLAAESDYEVRYSNNTLPGTATVKVIGVGNYSGECTSTFVIKDPETKKITLASHGRTITTYRGKINFKTDRMCYVWDLISANSGETILNDTYTSYSLNNNFTIDFSELPTGTYYLTYMLCSYTAEVKMMSNGQGGYVYRTVYTPTGNASIYDVTIYNSDMQTTLPTQIVANVPIANGIRSCYLSVTTTPVDASLDGLKWSSSDESIATVVDGKVIFKKAGNVTIFAQINGLSAQWDFEIDALDLNNGGAIVNYDADAGSVDVVYDGELLEKDTDYTLSFTEKNGITIITVTGCNLFEGSIIGTYYSGSNNPYICEHTFGEWKKDGIYHWKECTVCGHVAHKTTHTANTTWSTDDNQHWHVCTECGCEVGRTNHTMSEWTIVTPASYTKEGTQQRTCSACGKKETSKIEKVTATDLSINKTSVNVKTDGSVTLIATCSPIAPAAGELIWSSSDESIVTVDQNGKVTAVGLGTAIISVSIKDSNLVAQCTITVKKDDTVNRIYGSTRYKTAFKTADALKEQLGIEKFDVIIVANGNNFADALSGSYLAGVKNAPILMMDGTNITAVCDYINNNLNAGGTVYLLGGKSVLPETLECALSNYNVKRLWGNTRYGTNLAILKEAGVGKADILVCTGNGFADSLSASAAKRPILLVGSSLTKAQKEFLDNLSGNKFYIIGGVNAVSTGIEAEIQAYGNTERIGGASRFRTSVMIAEKFFKNPQSAVIAYAYNFPDGLSGGPLAMSMDAPLILSAGGSEGAASAYMKKCDITSGVVLGGPGILDNSAVQKIFNLESEGAIKVW